jgi:hypothetical protein
MSTTTPRLGLYKPDGTDAFERTKFNETWDKLDEAPGLHICTSASRPAWGAGLAGRAILETDTGRILRWTGTTWRQVKQAANGWSFFNNWANENVSPSNSVNKAIGSLVTTTPGTCLFLCTSSVQYARGSVQDLQNGFQVDLGAGFVNKHGAERSMVRWAIPTGTIPGSPDNDVRTITVAGEFDIEVGTTPIRTTFETGNGANAVTIRHSRTLVWMVNTISQ